ncbi:LysR family transcriptional regulator [Pararobbsia silviterrae]|uniref:LysR family transcriptional regulator n=1 Tax=Pararobbsia silviterrae TaxID=1792498 RepID=A0A494XPM1_9BURK|nr:LysR family transcriptional regulator [Pararobbsia silviterrae]RKP51752.1 LysR family transcriptional regulator [Pararobbsia silviterrae]
MRLDILGLQAFIAVADHGGFQAAADAIHLSQTALSHRVSKLEAELGVPLFTRTTRTVALTREGFSLLPRARRLIHELHTSLHDIRMQGMLRQPKIEVGCVPTLAVAMLTPILAEFAQMHPEHRVRVFDGYASLIAEQVNSGELEFGLTIRRATHSHLSFKPLLEDRFVVVCRDDNPLAGEREVSLASLNHHSLIRNVISAEVLVSSGEIINWRYEAENVSTAIEMARLGMGATIVPSIGLPVGPGSGLAVLDLVEPSVMRIIGILRRPDVPLSDGARALMELVQSRVGAEQASLDVLPTSSIGRIEQ